MMDAANPYYDADRLFEAIEGLHTRGEVRLMQTFGAIAPGDCVNVGCYLGLSTAVLALASPHAVYAVDLFEDITQPTRNQPDGWVYEAAARARFDANLAAVGVGDKVNVIAGDSAVVAAAWTQSVGLVLLDFDPDNAARNMTPWLPHIVPGGYLLQHDMNERGAQQAVAELLQGGGWALIAASDWLVVLQKGKP